MYNGSITPNMARLIAQSDKAFEIYAKATGGKLSTKSDIIDMIQAAKLIAGFDVSINPGMPYSNKAVEGVAESDIIVPGSQTGIYDPETGKIILNKKADAQKKASYQLAEQILRGDRTFGNEIDVESSGKVYFMSGNASNLTPRQAASVAAVGRTVATITHNNVYFYESEKQGDKYVLKYDVLNKKAGEQAPNGMYDPKTGDIYIDLNAGNLGQGTIVWTASHELTHFIRQWSFDKFKALADFVVENYAKKGTDVLALVRTQQESDPSLSFEEAYEEVIADAMQPMFTDTNLAEKLQKLKIKDNGLWNRIKQFFADLHNKLAKEYKDLDPETDEAKLLRQFDKDVIERISDLFAEALVDAGDAYKDANSHYQADISTNNVRNSLRVKHSNGTEEIITNPREITNDDVLNYLTLAKGNKLYRNSYIPVRSNTPNTIIATLRYSGISVEDRPLVMQVQKARQSMTSEKAGGHGLSETEIVEVLRNLDKPETIIWQTNRTDKNGRILPDNAAVFVPYSKEGKEGFAVIEFDAYIGDSLVEDEGVNDYNTVVTIFQPDEHRKGQETDYATELLENPDNYELEIKNMEDIADTRLQRATLTGKSDDFHIQADDTTTISESQEEMLVKNSTRKNYNSETSRSDNLVSKVLGYMEQRKFNIRALLSKAAKKYRSYVIMDGSRLHGAALSAENLQYEVAADWLSRIFVHDKSIEKLVSDNMPLAIELADEIKAVADRSPDIEFKKFANDVFYNFYKYFRDPDNLSKYNSEKSKLYNGGIQTLALDNEDNGHRVNMDGWMKQSIGERLKDDYYDMKRGFVDSGEAIDRLAKATGNKTIYHLYNNAKQAEAAAKYMLTGKQTDIYGNEIGDSLNDILKPIMKNKRKFERFNNYLQYMNNYSRAKNGKGIYDDINAQDSLNEAEKILNRNPEFKEYAQKVYHYIDGLLDWQVESGLLSEDERARLKKSNPNYVPALVVKTDFRDNPHYEETAVISKGVKQAKGGDFMPVSILEALTQKTKQIVREAKHNMLANAIRDELINSGAVTQVGNAEHTEEASDNTSDTVNDKQLFEDYSRAIDDILSVSDEKAKDLADKRTAVMVLKNTPDVILNNVNDAKDLKVIINYNKLYLAVRKSGIFKGHYHNLGAEIAKRLPEFLKNPDAIIRLANGRLNVFSTVETEKGSNMVLSIELNSIKNIDDKYGNYNVVVTMFGANDSYVRNLISGDGVEEKYKREDLSQVNPQLYKWLAIINDKSSVDNNVSQDTDIVNSSVSVSAGNNTSELTVDYLSDEYVSGKTKFIPGDYVVTDDKPGKFVYQITATKDGKAEGSYLMYDPESSSNFAEGYEMSGNRITFYVDGIRHTMDVSRSIYEGVKNIDTQYEARGALKHITSANSLFKKFVTSYNPFFTVRNFFRDLQDAILFSSNTTKLLINLPLAYKEIATGGKYWQLYQSLGGVGSSYFDFAREAKSAVDQTAKGIVRRGLSAVGNVYETANMAVEQATRLAEFMQMLKQNGGLDASYSEKMKALYGAADVTVNFGRSGIYSKIINQTFVPFLNPGIQGASRFVRLFTETKSVKKWIYLTAKLASFGFSAMAINGLINHDDEDYEKLTEYTKENNYIFKVGDGLYMKIPKGRALTFFAIGFARVKDAAQGKDVSALETVSSMAEQIAPNNPVTDNIFMTAFLAAVNRTWYGGKIENESDENFKAAERYDETTDYFSRWLGGLINYSPKKIHYVLDAYTGVFGDYILPLLTPASGGKDFLDNLNVLARIAKGNFVVDSGVSNRISSDYYSLVERMTHEKNDYNLLDNTASAVSLKFLNSQSKAMEKLYDELNSVNNSDAASGEKYEKRKEIRATINGIMVNAMAVQEEVYSSAEDIKSKYAYKKGDTYYNEVGDELNYDTYIDIIYREVNRHVLGAEYALQQYNKSVYADAAEAVEDGSTYDLYYDAYFGSRYIEGDIDIKKGEIQTGSARKNKWEYIDTLDATQSEKAVTAAAVLDISEEKAAKAEMSGFDPDSRLIKLFDALNQGLRKQDKWIMEASKPFDELRKGKENERHLCYQTF